MFECFGVGEVAFDPEIKTGRAGDFLTFKVRTGKRIIDRQTGQPKTIQAYTRCVMFGERGIAASKRIAAGTLVEVRGELSHRKDDQGRDWWSVRVSYLGVPGEDCADQPKTDRGYWRDPGSQPQHAQQQSAGGERGLAEGAPAPQRQAHPDRHQTHAPQYAQAPPPPPQGNPYRDDGIPF